MGDDLDQDDAPEPFSLTASPEFAAWLAETNGSLALTTYQGGKFFLIGTQPDGKLSLFDRSFTSCMGVAVSADGRSLALATKYQVQRFDNVLPRGQTTPDGYDALYAPHAAWVTGDLDMHDMGWGADGRPVFVNTLFACIATVADGHSFQTVWKPPFISALAAEDRCHLNGLAMEDGKPRYATAVSRTDTAHGWRDHRVDGGVVIDIATSEIVVEGLSMPHSPRLHDGKLWLLNSGRGEFGFVDLVARRFEPVAFCPGYARGLAFAGDHAVIGLSLPRQNQAFSGLPLDAALSERGMEPRCGLAVVSPATGTIDHWMRLEGPIRELYDVAALPGCCRPSAIGFKSEEVQHIISVAE
jgi:uncharacterized protein (TIGR03032 family)